MMKQIVPDHLPAVLALGAVSQISQVLLLRELLMVFHGSELSIGIILAAWMVWVGLGSGLGSRVAERTGHPLSVLVLSAAGILLLLPTTLFFVRGLRGFFDVLPGAYLSLLDITLSSFVLTAPVGFLCGLQFVLLARLWRQSDRAKDTSGAGKTYIGEAVGNMLGGVLFTFLLVRYLNAFAIAILAAVSMPTALIWIIRNTDKSQGHRSIRPSSVILVLLPVAAVAAFPFMNVIEHRAYRLQWRHLTPDHELVETHQSKHGTIAVLKHHDQYSFFQSGHLIFSTAGPQAAAFAFEEQEAAVFAHFAMVQHPRPRRVLLIGGGLRGTLSEIAKHPVEQVDYVELDEVLTQAARPFVSSATRTVLDDPRVRLIHTDGRLFVKAAQRQYDMIIVDVPDPATAVLNRYYTEEFFAEAAASLHPDGVFVIGAVSTTGLRGTPVANRNATIYHTLAGVFSRVLMAGDRFIFYIATDSDEQISVDASVLQQRYLDREIETDGFSHHHFQIILQESQLRRINWIIRHHGRSPDAHLHGPKAGPPFPEAVLEQERAEKLLLPVDRRYFINSDFKPIGYYYTLLFWGDLARARHTEILKQIAHVQAWWILPPIGLSLFAALALRIAGRLTGRRPELHFAVLFTVFTTGLGTMAMQIALLFSFQSLYGFVFEKVGLIVAIFMGGLAAGTAATHRYVKQKTNTDLLAGVQLLIALLAGLIALALPGAASLQSPRAVFMLFSILTFGAGLLNGIDFPLATACCLALNKRTEKSAGLVYGLELLGASIGAALASAVVAPILGIIACCLLATVANATACAVLLIARRSDA